MRSVSRQLLVACLVACFLCMWVSEARYLPTRSQDDRLERLRELLRDLLEGDTDRLELEKRMFFKREAAHGSPGASAGQLEQPGFLAQ